MSLLHTLIAFFIAIGFLVVVHELGHYFVARWCGVKILRFSLGMGKVIFSRKFGKDQTEWCLSALPLGGYVKLLDTRDEDVGELTEEELKREFNHQSVWKRIAIVSAGPISNFLFAIFILFILFMHGVPGPAPKLRAVPESSIAWQSGLRGGDLITKVNQKPVYIWSELSWEVVQSTVDQLPINLEFVRKNSNGSEEKLSATIPKYSLIAPDLEKNFLGKLGISLAFPPAVLQRVDANGIAERAGLKKGDLIKSANGKEIIDALDLIENIRYSADKPLKLKVDRGGELKEFTVIPAAEKVNNEVIGRIGVAFMLQPEMAVSHTDFFGAIGKAVVRSWDTSIVSLRMFGKVLTGEISFKNISGPLTIANYAGKTAKIGLVSYLTFIAFISISLGIMNLLPIPVLDGGLLMYYLVEIVRGRPLSKDSEKFAQRIGLALLGALMVVAIFNDITRLVF